MTEQQMRGLYNGVAIGGISFDSFKLAVEAIEHHNATASDKQEAVTEIEEDLPDYGLACEARGWNKAVRAMRRAARANPSDKQEAVAKWIVAREAVVDTGTPRKELAYAVPPESRLWDSFSEASAAIKEMGLPIGWVAMELHRLIPDAAPPAQSAEQDRIDAERWRAFKNFAHHSYNQKVTSHAHSASLMKEHFITVHAGSWDELESHIDAAGASK
jgi:hypothetical protein